MRLITKQDLWRAFPELDRYGNDQCKRFVRSAKGSWYRRAASVVVSFLAGVATAGVGGGLMALFMWLFGKKHLDGSTVSILMGAIAIAMGLLIVAGPFLTGLITRDILLYRRVRHVLRVRGVCTGCGYTLVGLPVGADAKVTCPECAAVTETDPSLGDLATDEQGRTRFHPIEQPLRPPWFFTPKRVRVMKRVAITFAIAVPCLSVLLWTSWEIYLRHQAADAKAHRLTTEAAVALVLKGQSALRSQPANLGDPNAYDILTPLALERSKVETAFNARHPTPDKYGNAAHYGVDFTTLYSPPAEAFSDDDRLAQQNVAALSREMFDDYRASNLFPLLDDLAARPTALRAMSFNGASPAWEVLLPELSQCRQLARANAARMELARQSGDTKEWLRAFESTRSLARITHAQLFLIDSMVGMAIDALSIEQAERLLKTHPSDDVLLAIEDIMARQQGPGFTHALEGERLAATDGLAWLFEDPRRVRFGRFSPNGLSVLSGNNPPTRMLGTFRQNLAQLDTAFDRAADRAARKPIEWMKDPPLDDSFQSDAYAAAAILAPSLDRAVGVHWLSTLEHDGLHTLIALERYRNAHADYPQSLDQLVPEFLSALPTDPWSGKPLHYKRIDATTDRKGRAFLLYSVGRGADNDGTEIPHDANAKDALFKDSSGSGYDYILNNQ